MNMILAVIVSISIAILVIFVLRFAYKNYVMRPFNDMAQTALERSERAQQIKRQQHYLLRQQELAKANLAYQQQRARNQQRTFLEEENSIKMNKARWSNYYQMSAEAENTEQIAEVIKLELVDADKPLKLNKVSPLWEKQLGA